MRQRCLLVDIRQRMGFFRLLSDRIRVTICHKSAFVQCDELQPEISQQPADSRQTGTGTGTGTGKRDHQTTRPPGHQKHEDLRDVTWNIPADQALRIESDRRDHLARFLLRQSRQRQALFIRSLRPGTARADLCERMRRLLAEDLAGLCRNDRLIRLKRLRESLTRSQADQDFLRDITRRVRELTGEPVEKKRPDLACRKYCPRRSPAG